MAHFIGQALAGADNFAGRRLRLNKREGSPCTARLNDR